MAVQGSQEAQSSISICSFFHSSPSPTDALTIAAFWVSHAGFINIPIASSTKSSIQNENKMMEMSAM